MTDDLHGLRNSMNKYGGRLVYACRDDEGLIEVVENGYERSLHFGTWPRQSSMDLNDPIRLALSYTRAMTAALIFTETPRRILLLGLGGGSLAKFFLHHFPDVRIDAVEYRETVHRVAVEHFALPRESRLSVQFQDAGEFIRLAGAQHFGNYDLILVDAFVHNGIAESVCGATFFEACRARLSAGGMLAMNMWSSDSLAIDELLGDIQLAFEGGILTVPLSGRDNIIAFAGAGPVSRKQLRVLKDRALSLQASLKVEYPAFLRSMRQPGRWKWPWQ